MIEHVTRRLLLTIPTLIGITLLVFMLVALSPGGLDAALREATSVGDAAQRSAERAYLARRYGLDDHPLVQYARWLHRLSPIRMEAGGTITLAAPDLGISFARSRPVAQVIAAALPTTILLNVLSLLLVYAVAIPMGIAAALRRGTWIDSFSRAVTIALWSAPVIVVAVGLQGFFGRSGLAWFPTSGSHSPESRDLPLLAYILDSMRHLALPVICLSTGALAVLSRHTRAAVLENLLADHVRAARAKGLEESSVIARHVLRNSLLTQITHLATVLPTLISGSLVVESVFNLPGMGTLMLEAIDQRDREVLMGIVLLIGIANVLALLAADVLAMLADPRVRPR